MPMKQNITAIIYDKRGAILSIGKNSYVKTHPLQARYANKVGLSKKVFLHAEIDAIIKCKDISKAFRILIVRTLANGATGCAKPCPICVEGIKQTPIKRIEHS